jgi:uncharacterized surface protein with fasciclin (FAS1) repeats
MRNGVGGEAMMRRSIVAAACALAAACGGGEGNEAAPAANAAAETNRAGDGRKGQAERTILDSLTRSADHRTLANAVSAAGLTETLSGAQPYTLFAPTDAAFRALPAGTMSGLLEPDEKGHLTALLTGHIVPGTVTAADLGRALDRRGGKAQLATVDGSILSFSRDGGAILVTGPDGAKGRLGQADLLQSNGVIHSVDAVLAPPPS